MIAEALMTCRCGLRTITDFRLSAPDFRKPDRGSRIAEAESRISLLLKVTANRLRLHPRHHCRQRRGIRLPHRLHAAKVFQQPPRRARSDARNFQQLSGTIAHLPPLAVKSYGKTVRFIADH